MHLMMLSAIGAHFSQKISQGRESVINELRQLASSADISGEGPVLVGKISEIDSSRVLRTIASLYLTAFSQNVRIYPYLGG
jgi:hypothetical protein